MIRKVTGGSSSIGLLNYCYYEKEKLSVKEKERLTPADVRGEIVYIQNLGIDTLPDEQFDIDYLAKQFRDCADKNQNRTMCGIKVFRFRLEKRQQKSKSKQSQPLLQRILDLKTINSLYFNTTTLIMHIFIL